MGSAENSSDSRKLVALGRVGSRNTSPSRQIVVKTKPFGLEEETLASLSKPVPADVPMEDSIWAMLPEDLLDKVLARLPPFTLFRIRSVCKKWNLILQDSSFLKSHSNAPSHGPCLLTFLKKSPQVSQLSVFSFPSKTWYKVPFTFLPPWAFWLVGSSGGLLCFSGIHGQTFRTVVCNPLTQSWRILPSMHYNHHREWIMVVDRSRKSFRVISTGGVEPLPTEVYDSKTDKWSLHQIMPDVNLYPSKFAYCDSRLYTKTHSPPGLMTYRIDTGEWEHIPVKLPRYLLDGYLAAGTRKRLFLVGRIRIYSTIQGMRIWELDHTKASWVEISRMPPELFSALLRVPAERFECFGQDDVICFKPWDQGKCLVYNVDKKIWDWVSGCALEFCNNQVFFYEPRFDASVH